MTQCHVQANNKKNEHIKGARFSGRLCSQEVNTHSVSYMMSYMWMLFTVQLYILRSGTLQLYNKQKEPNFHSFDIFCNNNVLPCCLTFMFSDVLHTFKLQPIFCRYINVGPYTLHTCLPYTEYTKDPTAGVPLTDDNFHNGLLSSTCSQYPTTCI